MYDSYNGPTQQAKCDCCPEPLLSYHGTEIPSRAHSPASHEEFTSTAVPDASSDSHSLSNAKDTPKFLRPLRIIFDLICRKHRIRPAVKDDNRNHTIRGL